MRDYTKTTLKFILIIVLSFIVLNVIFIHFGMREIIAESNIFNGELKSLSIILVIALSISTSIVGYRIAKKKNKSTIKWSIICLFLNIYGVLLIILLSKEMVSLEDNGEGH